MYISCIEVKHRRAVCHTRLSVEGDNIQIETRKMKYHNQEMYTTKINCIAYCCDLCFVVLDVHFHFTIFSHSLNGQDLLKWTCMSI